MPQGFNFGTCSIGIDLAGRTEALAPWRLIWEHIINPLNECVVNLGGVGGEAKRERAAGFLLLSILNAWMFRIHVLHPV